MRINYAIIVVDVVSWNKLPLWSVNFLFSLWKRKFSTTIKTFRIHFSAKIAMFNCNIYVELMN